MADLAKLTPPKELSKADREVVFVHIFRRLAAHRNRAELWANADRGQSSRREGDAERVKDQFIAEIQQWAQGLLKHTWVVCEEPGGALPSLDPFSDSSTGDLQPLPPQDQLSKLFNTILFLHVTTSKQYSALTRTFLSAFTELDEGTIAATLKNPDRAVQAAEQQTADATEAHAQQGRIWRKVGVGVAAVTGGVLVGVTGGLAAPLVGAGVTTLLGWLGVGGTAAGLLASGLAGSSAVCGALFGAYGAKSSAGMIARHTREVRDFALVPVRPARDTLAVRLCVSGWLASPEDVTAPWTVFDGDDTYALQWEVEALQKLSTALGDLLKSHAMKYVRGEIIKRTVFASLMSSLAPIALLKFGQIVDNPWMNAKALAEKAGAVLGTLLAERVFGTRPITLTGYSLGALVVLEALKHLATLPPAQTVHLVQDVFLFGTPASTDAGVWSAVRRVVAGRLVNGYTDGDYVLAVLQRASGGSWGVAGLQAVEVAGVENVQCAGVEGHVKWRGMVGRCLERCDAPGIVHEEVEVQADRVVREIEEEMEEDGPINAEEEMRLMEEENDTEKDTERTTAINEGVIENKN